MLLIGKIRKLKFIMQTELANEVCFGIHPADARARRISPEHYSTQNIPIVIGIQASVRIVSFSAAVATGPREMILGWAVRHNHRGADNTQKVWKINSFFLIRKLKIPVRKRAFSNIAKQSFKQKCCISAITLITLSKMFWFSHPPQAKVANLIFPLPSPIPTLAFIAWRCQEEI